MEVDNLLSQHKLLLAVIATDWATRLDHKVAAVIIERYMRKQGNSRASLRYLEKATGSQRPNIIASTRRLLEHGVFHVVREGVGTRPTEYGLNFQFSASGIVDDTTKGDCSSGIAGNTSCGIAGNTSSTPSGIVYDTKNLLTSPADKPADSNVGTNDTPDPFVAGLTAATGSRDPESKFDRFWSVFPRKHGRKKAEAAWNKISPDDELADIIIAAAHELANHYEANPVDKKWMKYPANWLDGKGWTEDLPSVYADPKEAAIAKRRATSKPQPLADNDDEPAAEWTGEISPFVPAGEHKAKVAKATETRDDVGRLLTLALNIDVGGTVISEVPTSFYVEHADEAVQELGQDRIGIIGSGDWIEDAAQLVGGEFRMRVAQNGAVTYLPLRTSGVPGLAAKIAAARAAGHFSGEREQPANQA